VRDQIDVYAITRVVYKGSDLAQLQSRRCKHNIRHAMEQFDFEDLVPMLPEPFNPDLFEEIVADLQDGQTQPLPADVKQTLPAKYQEDTIPAAVEAKQTLPAEYQEDTLPADVKQTLPAEYQEDSADIKSPEAVEYPDVIEIPIIPSERGTVNFLRHVQCNVNFF